MLRVLSRTYAQAVAGDIVSMSYNSTTLDFSLTYTINTSCSLPTEIYFNQVMFYTGGYKVWMVVCFQSQCVTDGGATCHAGVDCAERACELEQPSEQHDCGDAQCSSEGRRHRGCEHCSAVRSSASTQSIPRTSQTSSGRVLCVCCLCWTLSPTTRETDVQTQEQGCAACPSQSALSHWRSGPFSIRAHYAKVCVDD